MPQSNLQRILFFEKKEDNDKDIARIHIKKILSDAGRYSKKLDFFFEKNFDAFAKRIVKTIKETQNKKRKRDES